jgi:hypothetical protein
MWRAKSWRPQHAEQCRSGASQRPCPHVQQIDRGSGHLDKAIPQLPRFAGICDAAGGRGQRPAPPARSMHRFPVATICTLAPARMVNGGSLGHSASFGTFAGRRLTSVTLVGLAGAGPCRRAADLAGVPRTLRACRGPCGRAADLAGAPRTLSPARGHWGRFAASMGPFRRASMPGGRLRDPPAGHGCPAARPHGRRRRRPLISPIRPAAPPCGTPSRSSAPLVAHTRRGLTGRWPGRWRRIR